MSAIRHPMPPDDEIAISTVYSYTDEDEKTIGNSKSAYLRDKDER